MRILIIHNSYTERGGEDSAVETTIELLKRNGHTVSFFKCSNDEINSYSFLRRLRFLFTGALYSKESYDKVREVIGKFKPDVVHIHNISYVLTPSVYNACADEKRPVIQSMHNYRLLLGDGSDLDFPEFFIEKKLGNWKKLLLRYSLIPRINKRIQREKIFFSKVRKSIVLSQYCKDIYTEKGFDSNDFRVVPPFIEAVSNQEIPTETSGIYVGRLADYKGLDVLLKVIEEMPNFHLRIVGDGPLKNEVIKRSQQFKNIEYLGCLSREETIAQIKTSSFLIFPSLCHETFGLTVLEAFACGITVIASRQTAAEELIEDQKTGLLFEKNNKEDLKLKIEFMKNNPEVAQAMGRQARLKVEQEYTEEICLRKLLDTYHEAIVA